MKSKRERLAENQVCETYIIDGLTTDFATNICCDTSRMDAMLRVREWQTEGKNTFWNPSRLASFLLHSWRTWSKLLYFLESSSCETQWDEFPQRHALGHGLDEPVQRNHKGPNLVVGRVQAMVYLSIATIDLTFTLKLGIRCLKWLCSRVAHNFWWTTWRLTKRTALQTW